jgi:hypothetical protein
MTKYCDTCKINGHPATMDIHAENGMYFYTCFMCGKRKEEYER